jgi:hypothetical protein
MHDLFSPASILEQYAEQDAVESFIAYRKKHRRAALTDRGARMLAKTLAEISSQGGDPTEALDIAQEMGWQSIKPEWYWRAKEGSNGQRNGLAGQQSTKAHAGAEQIAHAARARRSSFEDLF